MKLPAVATPLACAFYGDVPWEEIPKDENQRPVPGAMFWIKFSGGGCSDHEPPCTQHLMVVTPDRHWWDIDGRANNCTMKTDKRHRCWVRHGVPPDLTVDKAGLTCAAGAGSIQTPDWHGYLHNGVLDVSRSAKKMVDKNAKAAETVRAAEKAATTAPAPAAPPEAIAVPRSDAVSALSGITVLALDTDPEPSLALVKENIKLQGWTLLSVIQHEFHGRAPAGFIVVYYDPKADKGRVVEP
jgi:hypothetical protein